MPVLLPLGIYTRRTALRLPEAQGPLQGISGADYAGEPLRLLLVGESTVVGVGVKYTHQALVAQVADAISERLQCPVCWQALGENGITAEQACSRLLPGVLDQSFDLALLVFGVNDTTHLTSLKRWCRAIETMARRLQAQGACVAVSAVPPMEHFSALPWLLRHVFGERAAGLNAALKRLACTLTLECLPITLEFSPAYLAEDGYHPSALGYQLWAQSIVESWQAATLKK